MPYGVFETENLHILTFEGRDVYVHRVIYTRYIRVIYICIYIHLYNVMPRYRSFSVRGSHAQHIDRHQFLYTIIIIITAHTKNSRRARILLSARTKSSAITVGTAKTCVTGSKILRNARHWQPVFAVFQIYFYTHADIRRTHDA